MLTNEATLVPKERKLLTAQDVGKQGGIHPLEEVYKVIIQNITIYSIGYSVQLTIDDTRQNTVKVIIPNQS